MFTRGDLRGFSSGSPVLTGHQSPVTNTGKQTVTEFPQTPVTVALCELRFATIRSASSLFVLLNLTLNRVHCLYVTATVSDIGVNNKRVNSESSQNVSTREYICDNLVLANPWIWHL